VKRCESVDDEVEMEEVVMAAKSERVGEKEMARESDGLFESVKACREEKARVK
jgi:hypothetical protein